MSCWFESSTLIIDEYKFSYIKLDITEYFPENADVSTFKIGNHGFWKWQ